jgi:hypothetical protein
MSSYGHAGDRVLFKGGTFRMVGSNGPCAMRSGSSARSASPGATVDDTFRATRCAHPARMGMERRQQARFLSDVRRDSPGLQTVGRRRCRRRTCSSQGFLPVRGYSWRSERGRA